MSRTALQHITIEQDDLFGGTPEEQQTHAQEADGYDIQNETGQIIQMNEAETQFEPDENITALSKRSKGRPRSEKSKKAILKATNTLLLHLSVQDLSIEAIAKKAKVGKTTIYRWWPNKTAIVMEALMNQPGVQSTLPTPKNNAEALILQLEKLIRLLDGKNGETISQLFSEAQNDEKAYKIFSGAFITPLIDAIEFSIEQGMKDKEFRHSLDTKMTVDVLCGPIFFRLMTRPADLNEHFREHYPKEAVRLISA